MDQTTLALIAGAVLSLIFSYIPGLAPKYQALAEEWKKLIMAGLLLVVSGALYGLACAGILENLWPGLGVSCSTDGLLALVRIFIFALVANQSTFKLSPQIYK